MFLSQNVKPPFLSTSLLLTYGISSGLASQTLETLPSDMFSEIFSYFLPPQTTHRPLIDDLYIPQLQSLIPLAHTSKVVHGQVMNYLNNNLPHYLTYSWEENWANREDNTLNNALYSLYIHRIHVACFNFFNSYTYAETYNSIEEKLETQPLQPHQEYAAKTHSILQKMPHNSYGYNLSEYFYSLFNTGRIPTFSEETEQKYRLLPNKNNPNHLSQMLYCYKNGYFFVSATLGNPKRIFDYHKYLNHAEKLIKGTNGTENEPKNEYLNSVVKYCKSIDLIQQFKDLTNNDEEITIMKIALVCQIINDNLFINKNIVNYLLQVINNDQNNVESHKSIALSLEKRALSWLSNLFDKRNAAASYFRAGHYEKAAEWYDKVAQDLQATLADKRLAADAYFKAANYAKAAEWWEQVAQDPQATLANKRNAAASYFNAANYKKAAEWYDKVAQDLQATVEDKRYAAASYSNAGHYAKAAEWGEKLAQDPQATLEDKLSLGLLYIFGGFFEKAEQQLNLYLSYNHNDVFHELGFLFEFRNDHKNDIKQALNYYTQAIEKGDNSEAVLNLARLKFISNEKEESIKLLNEIRNSSGNVISYFTLIHAFSKDIKTIILSQIDDMITSLYDSHPELATWLQQARDQAFKNK